MSIINIIKKKVYIHTWVNRLSKQGIIVKKPKMISDPERIEFGDNVYIGPDAYIMSNGGFSIGSNVIISANFSCWTENHNFKDAELLPYDLKLIKKPILIHDNVWIGLNVMLCPGTEIGEGCVVGMGSVVHGSIPPLSIIAGNPARIIGTRDEDEYNILKSKSAFFYPKMRTETKGNK